MRFFLAVLISLGGAGLASAKPVGCTARRTSTLSSSRVRTTVVPTISAGASANPSALSTTSTTEPVKSSVVSITSTTSAINTPQVSTTAPSSTTAPTGSSIWQPAVGERWQIVLQPGFSVASAATEAVANVTVFDIDLYSATDNGKDAEGTIGKLHALGKKVICYFSAGTYEPYRPDSDEFDQQDLGATLPDWPDEKWLDIRSERVRAIMKARIELAANMGCDAIDPDNMDGYGNENGGGFNPPLTEQDSIDYLQLIAAQAKSLNMATGLKNALSIIPSVIDFVQFAVNEECASWTECGELQSFVAKSKPVYHIEYPTGAGSSSGISESVRRKYCDAAGTTGFSTLLKSYSLDEWVQYCDGLVIV